ncbi:MAG: 3-isopropylmalate dehydratase small subunit [Pseudomonadota bacterium]
MSGWTVHSGRAVALMADNIDTDQVIPARFMSVPRSEGYGQFLLHDLRFDDTGAPTGLALDAVPGASVLVAGRNFGSGSSREAAVYALVDFGFRVVAAPSFGDIFAANAVNNGLLPAIVSEAEARVLAQAAEDGMAAGGAQARVDIKAGRLRVQDTTARFALSDIDRTKLMQGWDDIDLTRAQATEIAAFRAARRAVPGAWPAGAGI